MAKAIHTNASEDAQDGENLAEYQAMRAIEEAVGYMDEERAARTPVKVLTARIRWACKPSSKEKTNRNGEPYISHSQTLFDVSGNRIVLMLARGGAGLPDTRKKQPIGCYHPGAGLLVGPGHNQMAEIYGLDKTEEPEIYTDRDGSRKERKIIFIKRAAAFYVKAETAPAPKPKPKPTTAPTAAPVIDPKTSPAETLEARKAELAALVRTVGRNAAQLTARGETLRKEIFALKQMVKREQTEQEAGPAAPATATETTAEEAPALLTPSAIVETLAEVARHLEIAALVEEQRADLDGTDYADEDDEERAELETAENAQTIEHDQDGAELAEAGEPWAGENASLPLGAHVDADCWDCPARCGSRCTRAACLFAEKAA